MCTELMLIIEVDGIIHLDEEIVIKDEKRQKELEQVGFKMIRFQDDEILNDIQNVERTLLGYIEEYQIK